MEAEGYEVKPFLLPACAVNAPHRRDRIWFVAYSGHFQRSATRQKGQQRGQRGETFGYSSRVNSEGSTPNPDSNKRCQRGLQKAGQKEAERYVGSFDSRNDRGAWENFPTQSPVLPRNDGVSERLYGITFPKWRNESSKAEGNAIVTQVGVEIFRTMAICNQRGVQRLL